MTEVHHLHEYLDTDFSSETSTFTSRLSMSGFQANGTYVIFASCKYRGNNSSTNRSFVLLAVDGTNRTVTEGKNSFPGGRNKKWQAVYVHTFGASPGTADIMFARETTGTFNKRDVQLMAFRLDDNLVEGKDWKWASALDDTPTTVTASWQDAVSVTFEGDQTSDWLVFGSGHSFINTITVNTHMVENRMTLDGATSGADASPLISHKENNFGWGVLSQTTFPFMKVYKNLSPTSHTVRCQFQEAHASNVGDVLNYTLFALNLSKFKTVNAVHSDVTAQVASGEVLITNVDVTPTVTGDYFFFWGFLALNISGTSAGENGDNVKFKINTVDYTPDTISEGTEDDDRAYNGFQQQVDMGMVNLSSGGNVDLDCYTDHDIGNADQTGYSAVAFSMELAINRFIAGTVTEKGVAVARKVMAFRREAGHELLGSTTSSAVDGSYLITGLPSDQCLVVAQDDEAGTDFNAVIITRVLPSI